MTEEQKGIETAEEIIESLGITKLPICPEEVAHKINGPSFRLELLYEPFDGEDFLGVAIGHAKAAIIKINDRITDIGRKNFTAAHELGHVCMHIAEESNKDTFRCGSNELRAYDDPYEKEANAFASALLMPQNLILDIIDGQLNWSNIDKVSKACGTSIEATFRRLNKIIDTPAALIVHHNGTQKRFTPFDDSNFYLNKRFLEQDYLNSCPDAPRVGYPNTFNIEKFTDWVSVSNGATHPQNIQVSTILMDDGYSYTLLTYSDVV